MKYGQFAIAAVALLCMAYGASAQSQRFDVTGVVVDTTGAGLPQATVVALTREDSVLTKFSTSGPKGQFTLRRMEPGEYILQVTYVGFSTLRQDFAISDGDIDVGTVTLREQTSELETVIVSADHIPFVVKRDTLEYNANAFTTRPGDVVEDLLRRLPGIDVEPDGSIKAQGEDVKNVLVDGKEFFAETPTVATKNLPAKAVDKVQVYDKPSDQAEFTGIPDGQEEKTIDLLLKDEAKRGVLGNISGGLGGEQAPVGRYQANASLNRFSPAVQLSLIGNASNVGRGGIGLADVMSLGLGSGMSIVTSVNGMSVGSRSGGGFTESVNAGLNASRDFGGKNWIRSSYFLNSLDRVRDSETKRQELAGIGSSSFADRTDHNSSSNLGHSLNLNAQLQFSPEHRIRARSSFRLSSNSSISSGDQETLGQLRGLINQATTNRDTDNRSVNGTSSVTWRKRISDNGRSIVATGEYSLSDTDMTADLLTRTGLYTSGNVMTWEEVQQEQEQFGKSTSNELRVSLTEPLGGDLVFEVFGERNFRRREEDKRFYNTAGDERVLDSRLSDAFERTYAYYRTGAQLSRNRQTDWLTFSVNLQRTSLRGTVTSGRADVAAGFTHVLPTMMYKNTFKERSTIHVRYRASTREPSLRELQPYPDNDNPLRIYVGNPDLVPEYRHTLSGSYRFFDSWSLINIFVSTGTTYTRNRIVPTRKIDALLRQTVSAVNSDAGWTNNLDVSFGTPVRPLGIKLSVENDLSISRGSEFINAQENASRIVRNTVGLRVANRSQDVLELESDIRATFNFTDYSLNDALGQQYVNTRFRAEIAWHPAFSWTIRGDFRYQLYDRDVFGNVQNVALVNLGLSRQLLNERAEVELVVRDVFNQNLGVSFTNAATYIQEQRVESLGRYIMLRFSYRLSAMKGMGILAR